MQILRKIVNAIDTINRGAFWVVLFAMVAACLLVFLDVVLRYLFRFVTPFGFDMSLWMSAAIAMLSGGYIALIKEHIKVDIVYDKFPERTKYILNLFIYIAMGALAMIMIIFGMDRVIFYFVKGSVAMTGFNIYIWIKWTIVPIGGVLLLLQAISEFIKDLVFLITGTHIAKVLESKGEAAMALEGIEGTEDGVDEE